MLEYCNGKFIKRLETEEEQEHAAFVDDTAPDEPTSEERIAALEVLTDDIVLFMADLIGG